ncbi:centromere-associated protein E-like [Hydractinia symbiolongicarpus]|uniref:centromere-associated protein E-like n=1 Tax=Hydractinia symbiolongicarpus TaxID=13093 RepID=UPI00254F613A|nr:centromere-associated protein E-like [Hydractinia symbiolongicarpus]
MSQRKTQRAIPGKLHKSPIRIVKNAQSIGLDKNTTLEGSAIDIVLPENATASNTTISQRRNNFNKDSFKEKYYALQKTVNKLRDEIKSKKNKIEELQQELESRNDLLITAKSVHGACEAEKEKLRKALNDKMCKYENSNLQNKEILTSHSKEIDNLKQLHADIIITLTKKHEGNVRCLKSDLEIQFKKEREIHAQIVKSKDEKIDKLKFQMSTFLKDNSEERQHQIDELLKELKRVSDEAEYVKKALKKLKFNNNQCQKCAFYEKKCSEISTELYAKNETCKNLYQVCSKMERQLTHHEELSNLWEKVKKSQENAL